MTANIQQQSILARLRQGPMTTLQARQELDVLHPAARVMELRARGHRIVTHWDYDTSGVGRQHRVARYALLAEESGQ